MVYARLFLRRLLLHAVLALCCTLPVLAQDEMASAACRDSQEALQALQLDNENTLAAIVKLEALIAGEALAGISAGGFDFLFESDPAKEPPADDIRCASLRDNYQSLLAERARQLAQLTTLRDDYWSALPDPVRRGLERLRGSGERVATSAEVLQGLLGGERFAALRRNAADRLDLLDALRGEYLALLPTLGGEVDASDVRAWLRRWRNALDLALSPMQAAGPSAALSATQQAAVAQHLRLLRLDATTLAGSYGLVRGWLWESQRSSFRAAVPEAGDRLRLLKDEGRAVANILYWLYLDTRSRDDTLRGDIVWWRLMLGMEYLLGLLAFAALIFVARRTERLASHWQSIFARRYRGNRARAQLVRLTAGIPEWLPWLIGWLGLGIFEDQFRRHDLELLLPLLPFAQLYIVYGLLSMAGEWFVLRMAELGGSFLSDEEQAHAMRRSRRAAAIVILPWLLMDCVRLSLGPSLALSQLDLVTVLALLLALGLLLRPWQDEYIRALQAFIPERLDHACERLFRGRRFVILAPLASPLMVLAMATFFAHKGLVSFDWYRKLMARSFLLRSALPDDAPVPQSDESALAQYRRWFDPAAENDDLPFIRIGMMESLEGYLTDWLEGRSEENTLLLSGERSSGKTQLLKRSLHWLEALEESPMVHYLAVPAKSASPEALAELLEPVFDVPLGEGPAALVKSDEERPRTVLILDNAQNLFLRNVGGLAGWELLLSLTRARLRNVYWIISINNQSWGYLANVFGRYYQFNKLVQTRGWSQSEIRSLIMSRNQLSGSKIEYDRILLSSRGPEAGNIRNAEQLYFSLLWDACNGNPGIALQLWLSSITVSPGRVTVGLPEEVSGAALERLGDDLYFVYASLILHENMTSDEVVATTALPESLVRSALKIAFDTGFVERSENRRYRIVPIWYRTVIRLMARKNLLHE